MSSVAAAVEESSTNIGMVSAATEEMTSTIGEIAKNTEQTRLTSNQAVEKSRNEARIREHPCIRGQVRCDQGIEPSSACNRATDGLAQRMQVPGWTSPAVVCLVRGSGFQERG